MLLPNLSFKFNFGSSGAEAMQSKVSLSLFAYKGI